MPFDTTINDRVVLIPPVDGKIIPDNHLVAIWIDPNIQITHLLGHDERDSEREFNLTTRIADQEVSIGWTTDHQFKPKVQIPHCLSYVGKPGKVKIRTKLMELDASDAARGNRHASILKGLANVAALFSGAGPLAAASLKAIGAWTSYLANQSEDDLELAYFGSLGDGGLKSGKYEIQRLNDQKQADIIIPFHVISYKPAPKQTCEKKIRVLLEKVDLCNLNSKGDRKKEFNFTATFNSDPVQETTINLPISKSRRDPAIIGLASGLGPMVLYEGVVGQGIPMNLSVSLNGMADKDGGNAELSALTGVIDAMSDFGITLKDVPEDVQKPLKAAAQSPRAVLMEYFPAQIKIGSISGFLVHKDLPLMKNGHNFLCPDQNPILLTFTAPSGQTVTLHLRVEEI